MLGRESAIEGASADESGARMTLVERRGSNVVDILVRNLLAMYFGSRVKVVRRVRTILWQLVFRWSFVRAIVRIRPVNSIVLVARETIHD